jgi:hypothetical protein
LADTAKITVNLHEGKTHIVLNDGSGKWREWWYHQGRWKVKILENEPIPQINADWNATGGIAQILNKPAIPAAQVNADWNATSGITQILNKPFSFYTNRLGNRAIGSNLHTWLDGAENSSFFYTYAGHQHSNAPTSTQTETYHYLGLNTNATNYYSIIAINKLRSTTSSNVYIKNNSNGQWSSWKHIGDGSDAASLEGKKASDFALLNPSDGKIPGNLLNLSDFLIGQIIKQETEPTLPNESFAFWVNGSTFYLILRSNNQQKKLQFN